jgi:hypothetical protein
MNNLYSIGAEATNAQARLSLADDAPMVGASGERQ